MLERFTREARAIAAAAEREARACGSPHVGPEHILVAVAERCPPAIPGAAAGRLRAELAAGEPDADALAAIGISLPEVRRAVEEAFGPEAWEGQGGARRLPFSPQAKRTLELALREALEVRTRRIGAVEILLGLLREPSGAHLLLRRLGLDPEEVYRRNRAQLQALARLATR